MDNASMKKALEALAQDIPTTENKTMYMAGTALIAMCSSQTWRKSLNIYNLY